MAKQVQTSPIAQAEAHIAAGNTEKAVPLLRKAVGVFRGHPQLARVHDRLGTVLMVLGRHDEAVIELDHAVRLDPSVSHRYHLAQAYAFGGNGQAAAPLLEGIIEDDQSHAPSYARLAAVLQYTGERDRAIGIIDDAISRGLGGVDLVHSYATLATAHGRTADAIDRVRPLTKDPSIAPHIRGDLLFRLGKLLDDQGDHAAAWEACAAGNRIVAVDPSAGGFDAEAFDAEIDRVIQAFTPETIANIAGEGLDPACERAVLVVGMPRSGTTLIEQMIAAHPDAVSGGELRDFPRSVGLIPGMKAGGLFPPISRVRGNALKKARAAYIAAIDSVSPGASRVTDKLPFNFLRLGLVPAILPGSSVVHCERHPCDIALSCFFRNFQAGNAWSTDLASIARYTRAHRRLMEHWRRVLPVGSPGLRFLEARYERVVAEPERESRAIIEGIGLAWHGGCAAPAAGNALVPTLEPEQAGRGVYQTSRDRWRRYESALTPFIDAIGGVPGPPG